jgi:competence protein ComEA
MQLERKQIVAILVLAGLILFGGGYRFGQMRDRAAHENKVALEHGDAAIDSKSEDLFVHVAGAVDKPGVYQLPAGSRLIDAVNKAVPNSEADLNTLKLAAQITDGQTIYVPVKAPAGQPEAASSSEVSVAARTVAAPSPGVMVNQQQGSGKVNINTADLAQLDTLPGIGEAYAQRIIQYREINGPFQTIEDIKQVSGIGDKKFEQMKDLITVH